MSDWKMERSGEMEEVVMGRELGRMVGVMMKGE
jgi:hypothetical protein